MLVLHFKIGYCYYSSIPKAFVKEKCNRPFLSNIFTYRDERLGKVQSTKQKWFCKYLHQWLLEEYDENSLIKDLLYLALHFHPENKHVVYNENPSHWQSDRRVMMQSTEFWARRAVMRTAGPVLLRVCQQIINLFMCKSLICEMKIPPPVLNQV